MYIYTYVFYKADILRAYKNWGENACILGDNHPGLFVISHGFLTGQLMTETV